MLKKRSDTDIVTSLLIQWGNKLMNHLQKKVSDTKTCGENCQSSELCWEGTICSCSGGVCVVHLVANFICSYCIYIYTLGVMLQHKISADLSQTLFALVVGVGPEL